MSGIAAAILIALQAPTASAGAQGPVAWLVGTWSAQLPVKAGVTKRTPMELQVEVANGVLRVTEIAQDGDEMRCRLDGVETRSTQVKSKVMVEHILKCKFGTQSLEIRGRYLASDMTNVPPQLFEVDKKFEVAKDGSLRVRFQIRAAVQGFGTIDMIDERVTFARSR
jgi:hypothetical protein